jgi:hypothetical protein
MASKRQVLDQRAIPRLREHEGLLSKEQEEPASMAQERPPSRRQEGWLLKKAQHSISTEKKGWLSPSRNRRAPVPAAESRNGRSELAPGTPQGRGLTKGERKREDLDSEARTSEEALVAALALVILVKRGMALTVTQCESQAEEPRPNPLDRKIQRLGLGRRMESK